MKETVEGSKTVHRTATESIGGNGPVYSCTSGECAANPFVTNDKKEFEEHERTAKRHYRQGAVPCAICKKEVNMNLVLTKAGHEPIHDECIPVRDEL